MPIDQLIVIDWFSFFMRFIFSQDFQKHGLFMHFNDENCDKTLIFFTTVIDTSWRTWAYHFMTISVLRLMVVALKLNTIQCNTGVILKTLKIILKD